MHADRLISILLLLQTQRRTTVRELASRLEVSERTVQRDVVFEAEEQARAFALGFDGQMEVLAPPELREKVIQLARATVAMYAGRG
jgi:predicted DNA-binding transcriptional regulator YafY